MSVVETQAECIRYWETRATTAELKIKDWSVRCVEQELRIRELEADNVSLKGGWLRAQERIAKAKAILERNGAGNWIRALEALEGK